MSFLLLMVQCKSQGPEIQVLMGFPIIVYQMIVTYLLFLSMAVQKHLIGLFLLKVKSKYREPQEQKIILVLIKYVNL